MLNKPSKAHAGLVYYRVVSGKDVNDLYETVASPLLRLANPSAARRKLREILLAIATR